MNLVVSPTTKGEEETGVEGRVVVLGDWQNPVSHIGQEGLSATSWAEMHQLSYTQRSWPGMYLKGQPWLFTMCWALNKSLYVCIYCCGNPRRGYHHLRSTDVESKAQRDQISSLRSHNQRVAQMGFEPRMFRDHCGSSKQMRGRE